jgi:hypothetical protein
MTITYSRKLLPFVIPLTLFGSVSFAQQTDPQASSQASTERERVAKATIANMLPADGCSYPVTIGGKEYAPDAASREVMSQLVPAGSTIHVRMSYHLTGGTGTIECGFGTTRQAPEISCEILEVLE